ncbi:MAG: AMP-binding protein [Candidatus Moranbacteria bacterium]|nr:AMP-binding protein [Candidatus Moranbacteria bacterium]
MKSIYDEFKKIALKNSGKKALLFKSNSKWNYIKYGRLFKNVNNLAQSFLYLGIKTQDNVAILCENRPQWLMSDLALNKIGAVLVPIHVTTNPKEMDFILDDSKSDFLIVSKKLCKKHFEYFVNKKRIKKIILIGKNIDKEKFSQKFYFFQDLVEDCDKKVLEKRLKKGSNEVRSNNNNDREIFGQTANLNKSRLLSTIIYTSGTTGIPKGVRLNNFNFLSNVIAVKKRIRITKNDKFLSFLPLSHVLERTAGSYVPILSGSAIAYCTNIKKLSKELKEVNPTVIIAVPKIFERVYEKIFTQIKKKNRLIKKIFFWSIKNNKNFIQKKLAEYLILRQLRNQIFGSHLRFAVSGGAGINKNIIKFFKNIGVAIIEGYGLTETSPIISANSLKSSKIGSVGKKLSNLKIKLAPDKEIMVKGPSVTEGYWQRQDLNQEVFEQDWFKTGDLGFLDKEGFLTIIGRKKEIIVTSNGKNIPPEKIECLLNINPLIDQSLVSGNRKKYLTAIIIPNKSLRKKPYDQVKKQIRKQLNKINKELEHFERIRDFQILFDPFTIEEGELTATLKVKRKVIEAKYKDLIEKMYR